jgi:hypothetical protein
MAYTWTDLQNKVKRSFNDSTTNVVEYLKEAEIDFVERTQCLEKVIWFFVSTGNNGKFELPNDLIRIKRVSWDGEIIKPIQPYDINEYYTDGTSLNKGHVNCYFTHGNEIYFVEAPSSGAYVGIWYSYIPEALDSAGAYKKVNYDTQSTGSQKQRLLQSGLEINNGASVTATIVKNEFDNIAGTGTLTLKDVTGGSFANDEKIFVDDITHARVNGSQADVAGHGTEPEIPNKFRLSLVDYAKYKLYLDEEDENRASVYLQLYLNNIDKASASFINRDDSGPYVVRDVISRNNVI